MAKKMLMGEVYEIVTNLVYASQPGVKITDRDVAAKAGKLGLSVPQLRAWVDEASKLRSLGYARDQALKALPVVTGGKVTDKVKETKIMAAKKKIQKTGSKPNEKQLQEIRKVLAKHLKTSKGKIDVSSCVKRKSGTWTVGYSKKGAEIKMVCVRIGKLAAVTPIKDEPKPEKKKPAKKAKKKAAKKAGKKSKGRGKAVVVYFSKANLGTLKATKRACKKGDISFAEVVSAALKAMLKLK